MSSHKHCPCGRPIPDDRREDSLYCSVKCQRRYAMRRHRKADAKPS